MGGENIKINTPDIKAPRSDSPPLSHGTIADIEPSIEKLPVKQNGEELTPSAEEIIQTPVDINTTINQTSDLLKNVNSIKDELCKLPLDPCELNYINNNVSPLLNVLNQLANASGNLATSIYYLTSSSVVHPKKSDLKDTIHLIYNINDECEDVYKVLKHRINKLLKD